MDFALSDDQIAIQELAGQILKDRATQDRLREIEKTDDVFDRELWQELAKANLLGVAVPEEFGGMGFSFLELTLLLEEVGRTVAPVPALATLVMGALPIAKFGTLEQRAAYLPGVVSGDTILTAALVESGNDVALKPQTRAKRDGDVWRVDGAKFVVPAAHLASRILVPVMADDQVEILLVDPSIDGVRLERLDTTSGEPQYSITFAGATVPESDRIPGGASALEWIVDRVTTAYCVLQTGICDRATRMTAEYVSEREQFGKKLSMFQAVAQRAANCYIDTECISSTARQAAWRLSEEMPSTYEVAIAKYWSADSSHRISYAAQHLHGGIGVDIDYPLHRYCLWAKQIELTLGSASHQLAILGHAIAEGRL